MELSPLQYFELIKSFMEEHSDHEIAQKQIAYMKDNFEYYGLQAPTWTAFAKSTFKEKGIFTDDRLKTFVRHCMEDDHREMHYIALQMVEKAIKKQPKEFIDFLEELILTNSWWDSVDWIKKMVGIHFKRFPELRDPITRKWMDSGNMWLQRVCIIFQLTYKHDTDAALLFKYILEVKDSQEFFLQKAAGWALRQYSKSNPDLVKEFIESNVLPKLTVREGMKYIK